MIYLVSNIEGVQTWGSYLPLFIGIIASVGEKGKVQDIELVRKLVMSHIEKESCLVLLAVSCESVSKLVVSPYRNLTPRSLLADFENQGAVRLAKECDPLGKRTIGALFLPVRHTAGLD